MTRNTEQMVPVALVDRSIFASMRGSAATELSHMKTETLRIAPESGPGRVHTGSRIDF